MPLRPSSAPNRDASLETLRAIACLALVSYHVVGASPSVGMELPEHHWLTLLNGTFIDMRMPLFSFLSGCVFISLEQMTRGTRPMLVSKTRRLLLPMVTVGALFWAARAAMGMDQLPLAHLLILPHAHFWFLQATFLIMGCFLLLNWLWPGQSTALAAGLMTGGALLWLFAPRPPVNLFSMVQAAYLMPFFMLGYLCAHGGLRAGLRARVSPGMAAVALMGLAGLGYALVSGQITAGPARGVLTLAIGITFCLSLLALAPRHAGLARLGGYSYTIYLFHVFFTAGSREAVLAYAPQTPDLMIWSAGMLAGIAGPVLLHHGLSRVPWLSGLFLGTRIVLPRRPTTPAPGVAQTARAQRA